jgi:glycine cleavage system H protein
MTTTKPQALTFKDYLWIIGVPVGVIALIPLIAAFGVFLQAGFVVFMPIVLIATTAHAFAHRTELSMMQVQGIDVPKHMRLHPRHSWARRASSKCVVTGADDFAQRLVGKVDTVETAEVGKHVAEGDVIAVLRHGEREIPVHAPIDGTVAGINPALARDPAVVNRAPYGRGWLVELTPVAGTLTSSLKNLLGGETAMRWMRGEIDRLVSITAPDELGHTLADGGEVAEDVSEHLDEATWRKVKNEFFS